jgi:AcrR family transcriptional regulator
MVQKEPAPRRGRPRKFETDKALNDARRAFWNGGFAATSLDELAQATGLNRPSLYGAFGDKRALYLKALERSADESVAAITATFSPDLGVREGLGRVFTGSIGIYMAGDEGPRGCFIVCTGLVESVTDPAIRAAAADALARIERAFQQRFELARARKEINADASPEGLAMMASAVINSLALRARAGLPREQLEAIAAAGLAMICGAAGAA